MVPTINAFLIAVMAATFSGEKVSEDIHRFLEGQRGKFPKEWEEDVIEAIAQELLRGRKPKRRVPKGWVSRTRYLTNVPEVVRWRFEVRDVCSEGEGFLVGRTGQVLDMDWQGVLISLRHSGNVSNRNEMTEEPNGWHFGKIDNRLFLFLTSLDEPYLKALEELRKKEEEKK